MARFSLLIGVPFILATLVLFQCRERITLAVTLAATFIKFPNSHVNVINISDRMQTKIWAQEETLAVPAIVHQVLLGDLQMRTSWEEARASCQQLHPSWEFKLWQDTESNRFVQKHYPQLYSTYRGYELEIQRSNILRYLLLHHFGGMYFDLDLKCRQPLDFLRNETFLTPPANPTGINNAFIVSSKGHDFWVHMIQQLVRYDRNWYFPYLTNMFSTGCHFLSTMHRTYKDQASLRILDPSHKLNGHVVTPLFEHLGASSWHKGDAKMILRLGLLIENLKKSSKYTRCGLKACLVLFLFVMTTLVLTRWYRKSRSIEKKNKPFDLESLKSGKGYTKITMY